MFPRLHVNDKEKGGPRAPPRNKMALYEQLSIPSQRFNPGLLSPNSLQTSSSKGIGVARNMFVPLHLSPIDNNLDENLHSHLYSGANFGSPVTQIVQEKREGDEDDYSVPVYVQSGTRPNVTKGEKGASATPKPLNQQLQGERDSGQRRIFSLNANSKEDITRKCKVNGLQDQELEDLAVSTSANDNGVEPKSKQDKKEYEIPMPRTALSCSDENHANPKECDDVYVKGDSAQKGKIDRTDAVSEISMLDSISCSDVSPDDVVGVIGQRHFWKAREMMANQQRVFAFQLFELHRLIKVQQLIAGSPQLCVEDRVFPASSTPKVSPTTRLSSRCNDKLPLPAMNSEASKKLNHKMECSAENAMSNNTSLYFAKNGHHSGIPHSVHSVADQNMASWCFPQSPAHQWLIPVMSPSEGLVYKPCPAPGFIGTFPPSHGSSQLMGGFANPTQGNGVFPINPPTGHYYIHPYSTPSMNSPVSGSVADQTKSSCRTGSNCQQSCSYAPTQKSGFVPSVARTASELQACQQSCSYAPTQKSGFVPSVARTASELQARSGSCNGEKDQNSKGRNSPIATKMDSQSHGSDRPTGVIKVVPRNPRSAVESAARIFQSIQEERKLQSM